MQFPIRDRRVRDEAICPASTQEMDLHSKEILQIYQVSEE